MFAKRPHASHDFELNLTPIIDCFVTLICFLLLSSTYVNLVGMDAKVPISVVSSTPQTDTKPKFKLDLNVGRTASELVATAAGKFTGKKTFAHVAGGKPDLGAIHAQLVQIKKDFPKEFSINFESAIEMPYEDLVHIMDATRNLDPKDGTFMTSDERNGKQVKVELLFPDFVWANLGAKDATAASDRKPAGK